MRRLVVTLLLTSAAFASVNFSPRDLTSNTSHSPFVVSTSSHYGDRDGWMAFDGREYSAGADSYDWLAGTNTGWLKLDLGAGNTQILKSYSIHSGNNASAQPKNWVMEGSNDNATWDLLDTVTNQTAWGNWEVRTFTADTATTAYRYFRLTISANNGLGLVQVSELQLFTSGLSVTSTGLGSVTDGTSTCSANTTCVFTATAEGSTATLTATPEAGHITLWEGCATIATNVCTLTVGTVAVTASTSAHYGDLARTGWTANATDSYGGMTPDLAIDGSSLSGLSTQWNSANPDFTSPKDWWVDFGSTRAFNYVKYWPRQDVYARLGKDTEVYVSADGLSWGAAIATYSNPLGAIEKIIAFPLQTARFLKLRFLNASEAGGDISISELNVGLDPGVFPDVLPHYLTNNTSHAPFVLSDSLNNGNAWAMLDGGWLRWGQYAATPGAIWQVDMGAKYKIYTYRLHATLVNTQNPKAWTLDGSDDAAAWTTLDSESGKTDWYVGGANCINMTFPLAGTVAYRYYRLNVSETNGDATNVNIGEIYFFGEAFSPKGGSYATVM